MEHKFQASRRLGGPAVCAPSDGAAPPCAPRHQLRRTAVVAALLAATYALPAAAAEKRIEVEGQNREDAAVVTKVTYGHVMLQCGLVVLSGDPLNPTEVQPVTPFQAGDDWLQKLTIYLLNRTNKPIALAQIRLAFPETGDGKTMEHPMHGYIIELGQRPEAAKLYDKSGKLVIPRPGGKALTFAPGETLPIHVGDYIDQIKASIANSNIAFQAVTNCTIRRQSFFFPDGMRWSPTDGYSVPDPERPGRFKNLDPTYFPGTPVWPPGYGDPNYLK